MLRKILLNLILCSVLFFVPIETANADLEAEYVKVQAENIQLTADKSSERFAKEHYKKLYEDEKLWKDIDTIIFIIALALI